LAVLLVVIGAVALPTAAQDTANLSGQPKHSEVDLHPTTRPVSRSPADVQLGGWTYRSVRSPNPRDGVAWELICTPIEPLPKGWAKGRGGEAAGFRPLQGGNGDIRIRGTGRLGLPFPIVEVPDVLWKQWMTTDLRDVVGIHFHEAASDDLARILITLH